MIVYEYPFNERIRMLLRLEDLHEKFTFFMGHEHPRHHHAALCAIFEMLEMAGRSDLKTDLLQELVRQKQILLGFRTNPNVKPLTLDTLLSDIDRISAALIALQGKIGQHIRENEWLMSIRGRTLIAGGACAFDLPSYHAWQQDTSEQRQSDINTWFAPLTPLFDAIGMVLRLLRDSGQPVKVIAHAGSYQQMPQGKSCQMLRLSLQSELRAIPEISANKYMLWIRFTTQNSDKKTKAVKNDVPFELSLCNF